MNFNKFTIKSQEAVQNIRKKLPLPSGEGRGEIIFG